MKVLKANKNFENVFPMKVTCTRVVDEYGFSYGDEVDFCGSELEVDASDIKAHKWQKYPDYDGTDYGVLCPVCGQFVVIDKKLIPKSVLILAEEVRLNS